jgi:hypothetical protein
MNNKKRLLVVGLLLAFCATLFSFTPKFGGEGFQVYVNNKMVLERYGSQMDNVQTLTLDEYSANGQVTVKYYHCGKVSKGRVITIKDDHQNILKQWKFSDVAESMPPMNCSVKEIIGLRKNINSNSLNLYYASSELPNGRLLATLIVDNATARKVAK